MISSQILGKGKDDLVEFSIFISGLIFGSFLNMLIYRLPLEISLLNPKRSICVSCKTQIKWYENIPLLSYIILKTKCPNCDEKISITYPIVEFLTAFVTLLIYTKVGLSLDFIIYTLIFYTLIVLAFIDFKYKAVPDYLLILVLILTLGISNLSFSAMLMFTGGFFLLELIITFYIQNIKSRIIKDEKLKEQRAMGEGDIPIAAVIGGILGIKLGILAIFLSAVFAIIPSLINTIVKKDIETPFIPFLSLALFIVFIFDDSFINILGTIVK